MNGSVPEGASAALDRALGKEGSAAMRSLLLRYGSEIRHRDGRVLAWQGEAVERAFLLVSGSVRPLKHRIGASDIVLPAAGPGDWVCLAETVAASPVQADYACFGECGFLAFPARSLALLRAHPETERWISLCLAREAVALGSFLSEGGPLARIASFLLSRRKLAAGLESSSVTVTQAEIAASLGLTRETVNKRLAELESRGIVETARGSLKIPDWAALEEILGSD
jgi:CRP/FNR family transcriptional regulator, cyclic AMP receptor protein